MSKSSPEQVIGFLLEFLPNLLPKPIDSATKAAIETFRTSFDGALREPRIHQELLSAAQRAESEFRKQALTKFQNDDLSQAIASFPLFDHDLFQKALADFPNHLQEEYLAQDLENIINNDWKGKFSAEELREGVALYLNCLRVELIKVEVFSDIVVRLATLRSDQRTEKILEIVTELARLTRLLLDRESSLSQTGRLKAIYQLPPKVTDFVGRKKLVDEIVKDIEENKGATISSMTGMGGIGKTALGLEIAHKFAEKFPDGQIFLDLKGTASPLNVKDILRHIILSFEPTADLRSLDEANLIKVYQSILHGKKVLIFLDNARSSEQVSNLQPPPTCAMLVTSRWVFPLAGLRNYKVGILNEEEAVIFLQELCPRINEQESIVLARACGYLPLALRIAGSFLQVNIDWRVNHYLERLIDSKNRLTALQESRKEAEMADELDLISTFDLSYSQLDMNEQRAWRLISVFQTSFTLEAVAYIWNATKIEAQRLLGIFRRYSLLEFNESLERYEFHDLLNEFAHTKIKTSEFKLAKSKHALYYSELIDNIVSSAFSGDNFIKALRVIDFEMENIHSGFWFATSKNDAVFLSAVIRYARPIDILKLRLHPLELIKWSTQGLAAARKLGDIYAIAGHYGDLGITYLDLGEIDKSIECHKNSMKFAQKINDKRTKDLLIGNALGNLGQAYEHKGDYKIAKQNHEQALALSRMYENKYSEAMDLLNLGSVKSKIGEDNEAITYTLEAKEIFTKLGFTGKVASCLVTLGNIYTKLQQLELALDYLIKAQNLYVEIGDTHNLGACIQNIGNIFLEQEDYDNALDYFKQALDIATFSSDSIGIAQRMVNIGTTLFNSQRKTEAIPYFEQAILISKDIGAHALTLSAVSNLLFVYLEINNKEKVSEIISSAIYMFPEGSDYKKKVESMQRHFNLFGGRLWKDLSELDRVLWIIREVEHFISINSIEAGFELTSRIISNDDIPQNFRELGYILQKYISGEKDIDLSILPKEFIDILRRETKINKI